MTTVTLNRFDGGITPDIRDTSVGVVKTLKHFDVLTRPKTLTPFHSQVTGDSASATQQMEDFLYYNSIVYGAGTDSGTNKITVHTKSDFTSATWGSQGNNAGTSGTPIRGVFIEYKGYGYGFYADGRVWRNSLAGAAWVDTAVTFSNNSAVVGSIAACVHSKDDRLYMASGNLVYSNSVVTPGTDVWSAAAALTLPTRYNITSMCEYGNYLAIACKPLYAGKSVVYLWDRDSSLATISEVIDFGLGNLQCIEQVEGTLIGISLRQDVFASLSTKIVLRAYTGNTANVFKELLASTTTGLQLISCQKFNANRLYFLAGITIDGTLHNGVWGVGKNASGRWIVWFDKLPNNDTAIASGSLRGFFMVGDFTLIAYSDSGYKLTQTSSTSNAYAGSSLIETVINPEMPTADRTKKKQLTAMSVSYDPLPSGGQVICKYKIDGGSWLTLFTETTQNMVTTEKTLSSTLGRELQFRIESTGGALITEIKYAYDHKVTLI